MIRCTHCTSLPLSSHQKKIASKTWITQPIFLPFSQTHACMNTCMHTCTLFYGYFKKQMIYILVIDDQLRHIPTWYHKVYFLVHYPNTPLFSQSKFLSLCSELLYQFSNTQTSLSLHCTSPVFPLCLPNTITYRSHSYRPSLLQFQIVLIVCQKIRFPPSFSPL